MSGPKDSLNAWAVMLIFARDAQTPIRKVLVRCSLGPKRVTIGPRHVQYDRTTGMRVSAYNPAVGPQRLVKVLDEARTSAVCDFSDRGDTPKLLAQLRAFRERVKADSDRRLRFRTQA